TPPARIESELLNLADRRHLVAQLGRQQREQERLRRVRGAATSRRPYPVTRSKRVVRLLRHEATAQRVRARPSMTGPADTPVRWSTRIRAMSVRAPPHPRGSAVCHPKRSMPASPVDRARVMYVMKEVRLVLGSTTATRELAEEVLLGAGPHLEALVNEVC